MRFIEIFIYFYFGKGRELNNRYFACHENLLLEQVDEFLTY